MPSSQPWRARPRRQRLRLGHRVADPLHHPHVRGAPSTRPPVRRRTTGRQGSASSSEGEPLCNQNRAGRQRHGWTRCGDRTRLLEIHEEDRMVHGVASSYDARCLDKPAVQSALASTADGLHEHQLRPQRGQRRFPNLTIVSTRTPRRTAILSTWSIPVPTSTSRPQARLPGRTWC